MLSNNACYQQRKKYWSGKPKLRKINPEIYPVTVIYDIKRKKG